VRRLIRRGAITVGHLKMNMSFIPSLCMEYTKVFNTMKIENVIVFIVGLILGMAIGKWMDR
jgi:hypothetical protein